MSKILIAGHTGLVGSNLYKKLQDEGHELFGASRSNGYDLTDKVLASNLITETKPEIVYCLSANAAESRGQD